MQAFGAFVRQRSKKLLARPASPVVGYFDRSFQRLQDHLDSRLNQLYDRVATEVETISELTLGMQRFVDVAQQTADATVAKVDGLLDSVKPPPTGAADAGLPQALAERLANWVDGDGLLVLSIADGTDNDDDAEHLADRLADWEIVERRIYARRAARDWEPITDESEPVDEAEDNAGVAVVTLRRKT